MAVLDKTAIPEEWLPRLDPEWVTLWNEHGRDLKRADEVDVALYRKDPSSYSFTYPIWSGPEVHAIKDVEVPVSNPTGRVKVRIYSPGKGGRVPVHFNMHGGGWVLGGLSSEQAWCRSICNTVGVKVIDIDYRLGPEFKFPIAIYDCWAVIQLFVENAEQYGIDTGSISVGGLSAGGHMTAVLAMFARDAKLDLKLQLMVVPSVDLRWSIASEPARSQSLEMYPSITEFTAMPWGPASRMHWFMDYWIGLDQAHRDAVAHDWRASPILAKSFQGLAPAHLVTAEFDLSRDETDAYGALLQKAGVPVTSKRYLGVPHAFGHYNHPAKGLSKSHEYLRDTSEIIRKAHGL